MTPRELRTYLDRLVAERLFLSVMLWGPPGVGKSSIVAQVAASQGLDFVDVRLSQLAPTDLRGLPVPDHTERVSRWFAPEFLPQTSGRGGILFLDELNMAPPTMQGIAQQLILDRKVGSYTVPDGWFIWAAGNRKEDRAAVFEMPAPLANRFLHLSVGPDMDSFKAWALERGITEEIIAFLAFRPSLLHKPDPQQPAWPSPRSWELAGKLMAARLDIAPAVGEGAAAELDAYKKVYRELPSLEAILSGKGSKIPYPDEPSVRYAVAIGLTARAKTPEQALHGFLWLTERAPAEWVQLFIGDLLRLWRAQGRMVELAQLFATEPRLKNLAVEYLQLMGK